MFRLADWPIRRKLSLLIGTGALLALLLACTSFTIYDVMMIRAAKEKQITALADILGSNATTALEFHDPDTAQEVLSSLRLQPSVEMAVLFDSNGDLLAYYPSNLSPAQVLKTCPPPTAALFTREGSLVIADDILRDAEKVGTIYLRSDLKEIDQELTNLGWIALAVMTVSLGITLLITGRLQRLFTAPIHNLANAMERISAGESSMHVTNHGRDEMGVLCDGFNTMLDRIKFAHDVLEERVIERTEELQSEIFERKQAEEALREAKNAAEISNLAKSEFLANMSHEIRTPMTAILGFTDLLLENLIQSEDIDAAVTIKNNGEFLISLINNILDLSKVESGKLEIEQTLCSPHSIIAEVLSLMQVRSEAKGIQLEMRFDGLIPETILTDITRLRQILINIVGNAIKFTEVGSVQVVTRLLNGSGEEPKLQFDVIDTGIGIAEDKVENLFLPFTQADSSTTRRFGGTGLGLTICKRLTELLGGEISVSSTVGKGTTFSITINTCSLDGVQLLDGSEGLSYKIDLKSTNKKDASQLNCRVLLAEDTHFIQKLLFMILRKAGAEVTFADNGQIAFDLATAAMTENCPFDVILMDMQMPVLDGYDATRKLRKEGYSGPIVALTAHAMSSDRQKCLDAGCDDYITKPVDREKLIELIRKFSVGQKESLT